MAKGEFVDEITLIASLLDKKIQKQIVKSRLFKNNETLVSSLLKTVVLADESLENIKLAIEIMVNAIIAGAAANKSEGGVKKWMPSFFRFSTK
jgi:hypothetical protein